MEEDKEPFSKRCRLFYWIGQFCFSVLIILSVAYLIKYLSHKDPVPSIELASIDFTVFNITRTRLSAKWDLSIRIPDIIPGHYICLQGDLRASFLYKNVTLATSSPQKYGGLRYNEPQILHVSADVSGEDYGGLIGENIMKDIKEKKDVQFGSQFSLTDCREKTKGVMTYVCDEVNLRFEPGSKMKANVFENANNPTCINV